MKCPRCDKESVTMIEQEAKCSSCGFEFQVIQDKALPTTVKVSIAFEVDITDLATIDLLKQQTIVHLQGRVQISKTGKVSEETKAAYDKLKDLINEKMQVHTSHKISNVFWDTDHVVSKRDQLDILAPKG